MSNSLKLIISLFFSFYSICGFGQSFTVTVNQAIQDAPVGQYVTVQLTVENYEDIIDGSFSLEFNPEFFTYVGASNFNIPGLDAASLDILNTGYITVYFGTGAGVTVEDGTVAFNVSFLRIAEGESPIEFIYFDSFHFILDALNNIGNMELGQLIYTNFLGNVVSGKIFNNINDDCSYSGNDLSFNQVLVSLENEEKHLQTYVNNNGFYLFYAPPGVYELSIDSPYEIWEECPPVDITVVDNQVQSDAHLGLTATQDCEAMSIEISTPLIIRCFDTQYWIEYCNIGTLPVDNAIIELVLDENLTYESSSIPLTSQTENTLVFEIDETVEVGSCHSFSIIAAVGCDDVILGQTHCTSASIFPFEDCDEPAPLWDGSDLKITGECTSEEVIFTLRNEGNDMTLDAELRIIQDLTVTSSENVLLTSGSTTSFAFPANGNTYRAEVAQSPEHPFSSMEAMTVEGCGINDIGGISTGFVNAFPNELNAPNTSRWCMENVGSYDPNDKQAFPIGATDQHYIEANTDIEYLIRFQNTGTFTAFNVVVLDTISENFDINSIKLGNSSHDYRLTILEDNVLEFNFENIMLPDSATNEAGSNGFFIYKISQQPDLEDDNILENSAAIYFDFNEPVITNTTYHTIGREFLETSSLIEADFLSNSVSISPNPAAVSATVYLHDYYVQNGKIILYNLTGERIYENSFIGSFVKLEKNELNAGMYFFEIRNEGKIVCTDKIIFE